MEIKAVIEYNADGYLIHAENYAGAFARGRTKQEALAKFPFEMKQYTEWLGVHSAEIPNIRITVIQEEHSRLQICDADSDIIFESEKLPLAIATYCALKRLALQSAADFQRLYDSVPGKTESLLPPRRTFYGDVPVTAKAMYQHTKNVNRYYFGEIGVDVSNEPDIVSCRKAGLAIIETADGYLDNPVFNGSYGEQWSLHKALRRFIWHDRIHARAMYRRAAALYGREAVANPFCFQE